MAKSLGYKKVTKKKRVTKKAAPKKRVIKKRKPRKPAPKRVAKKRKRAPKKKGITGVRKGGPIGTPEDTKSVQLTFLEAYARDGTILRAAEAAKVSRQTHYNWMESDEDYVAAFYVAEEQATDVLEQEARRRAVDGDEEPVGFYMGEPGAFVTKRSDSLLKFLLEGRRAGVFKHRHELTGEGGGPIVFTEIKRVIVDPEEVEDEE